MASAQVRLTVATLRGWTALSEPGEMFSSLFLCVSAALQLFPSQAVGGAAEAFQSLLRILGPEAAMEAVIRAVSLSQDT